MADMSQEEEEEDEQVKPDVPNFTLTNGDNESSSMDWGAPVASQTSSAMDWGAPVSSQTSTSVDWGAPATSKYYSSVIKCVLYDDVKDAG